jgi:hypothetical protein
MTKRFPDSLAGLSDLFFNYEHPEYDKLVDSQKKSFSRDQDARRAALVTDATDFRTTLDLALEGYSINLILPSAEDFADDFLARL